MVDLAKNAVFWPFWTKIAKNSEKFDLNVSLLTKKGCIRGEMAISHEFFSASFGFITNVDHMPRYLARDFSFWPYFGFLTWIMRSW